MYRRDLFKIIYTFIAIFFYRNNKINASISTLKLYSKAPDFKLSGYNKNYPNKQKWELVDFKGHWVILYFYPKDFTNGCTLEAKGFEKNLNNYRNNNAFVVGISADTKEDHESFCSSAKLGYTLLSDPKGKVSQLYDSWSEPYSKRNTFLIDPEGKISSIWIGVMPINHASEVLEQLIKRNKKNA